ncbi:hypothetical protein DFH08DRAFT_1077052 [Mycena albidolilacea]|uniref:Uncharacterized protein n=1 Tax=Mycena albidolilacea TaxID=1033008 RepID=A0AAD7ABG6_9AGAR|nr:hypothetical protein DFH08DRAFT_1077052 [Mycena albidolilacea]
MYTQPPSRLLILLVGAVPRRQLNISAAPDSGTRSRTPLSSCRRTTVLGASGGTARCVAALLRASFGSTGGGVAAGVGGAPWLESCETTAEVELPYGGYCAYQLLAGTVEPDELLSWDGYAINGRLSSVADTETGRLAAPVAGARIVELQGTTAYYVRHLGALVASYVQREVVL